MFVFCHDDNDDYRIIFPQVAIHCATLATSRPLGGFRQGLERVVVGTSTSVHVCPADYRIV